MAFSALGVSAVSTTAAVETPNVDTVIYDLHQVRLPLLEGRIICTSVNQNFAQSVAVECNRHKSPEQARSRIFLYGHIHVLLCLTHLCVQTNFSRLT